MRHSAESTHIREFLCEFATIYTNILTRLSVTQVGLIDEKAQGLKSRKTVPLKRPIFKLKKVLRTLL
jgi:hypothetical protein